MLAGTDARAAMPSANMLLPVACRLPARLGARFPPAENRSSAVPRVQSENHVVPAAAHRPEPRRCSWPSVHAQHLRRHREQCHHGPAAGQWNPQDEQGPGHRHRRVGHERILQAQRSVAALYRAEATDACRRLLPRRLVTAPLRSRSCRNPSAVRWRAGQGCRLQQGAAQGVTAPLRSRILQEPFGLLRAGAQAGVQRTATAQRRVAATGQMQLTVADAPGRPDRSNNRAGVRRGRLRWCPNPAATTSRPPPALECPAWSRCAVPDSDRAVQASMMSRPASTLTSPPWSGYHAR